MQKKEIKIKRPVAVNPNPGFGPSSVTLTLDETYAQRLLANIDFVRDNEVRADKSRDEIGCVDFMCGADITYHGADEAFAEDCPRFRCYPEAVYIAFLSDSGPEWYESGIITRQSLMLAMKRKGWL